MRGSWRLNRTATYWPPLLWPQRRFFPVLLGCSTGGLGAHPLCDMFLIPASSLQLQLLNRGSKDKLCWVLAFSTTFFSNWLNFLCTELYNSSTSTFFLWASQIALIQPVHGQGYILIFLDRMQAVIYTGAISYFDSPPGSYVNIQHIFVWDGIDKLYSGCPYTTQSTAASTYAREGTWFIVRGQRCLKRVMPTELNHFNNATPREDYFLRGHPY